MKRLGLKVGVKTGFTIGLTAATLMVTPAFAEKGNAQAALDKKSMCVGCHGIPGYKASFPTVYSVPKIAGQSEAYLIAALQAYKKGDRKHPTMRGISETLTDQDMADLAAYYATAK